MGAMLPATLALVSTTPLGSAVVPELIRAGHEVTGLARSDASAAAIKALGAEVYRGDLSDPDGLRAGAEAADGDCSSRGGGCGAAVGVGSIKLFIADEALARFARAGVGDTGR